MKYSIVSRAMDIKNHTSGSQYGGSLSHFTHHSREAEEDMEQPLDLSQREPTVDKSQKTILNIDMEEPICQYTNCSCSLKHILSLDNKDPQTDQVFRPRCETMNSDDYMLLQLQKRIPENVESSQGHFHPKRRKLEQYNQSISRSSSDTNLYGYNGPADPFRSFNNYTNEEINQRTTSEGTSQPYWKSSQTFSTSTAYPSYEELNEKPCSDAKSLPKHAERLPKKRSHARNLSYDNTFQKHQHSSIEMKSSRTPSPNSLSADAELSQVNSQSEKLDMELPELNPSSKVNGEDVRASILAELRQEKDEEDVSEFRKRFFRSLFSRVKAKQSRPSSALDILISDKYKENLDFRPSNSHIDQIIRGEKPGKLCLMDIVELQVEIGLA